MACFLLAGVVVALPHGRIAVPSGIFCLALYTLAGIVALLLYNGLYGPPAMPSRATTSYLAYISLRFFNIFSFIAALVASYFLTIRRAEGPLLRAHVVILSVVALSAIYIYTAQIIGLWEPPRNRMGTGGQNFITEGVHYSYLFHRALGTFREPSHLGEWLVSTLLFVLPQRGVFRTEWGRRILFFISLTVMLLTGSLLALFCLLAGFCSLLFDCKRTTLIKASVVVISTTALIYFVNLFIGVDIIGEFLPRIQDIMSGGLGNTNRFYIYDYLTKNSPPFLGQGFGNGALIFAGYLRSDFISAIINIFLSTLYDAGVIGLCALITFFAWPIMLMVKSGSLKEPLVAGCLAAHISWMVAYFGRAPELSPIHAVIVGLYLGSIRNYKANNQHKPPAHGKISYK